MRLDEDNHLLNLIREGDLFALNTLYIDYREPFVNWAVQQYHCDPEDAIDWFQAAVVILYDNVVQGKITEIKGSIRSYLFRIGQNKAYEWLRQESRKKKVEHFVLQHLLGGSGVQDEAELERKLKVVHRALEEMGDPCRKILVQFYYYHKKMEQLAVEMNYKNDETIKNMKYKCLRRLQALCKNILTHYDEEE